VFFCGRPEARFICQAKHTDLIPGAGTDVDSQIESLSAFTEGSGISGIFSGPEYLS
jgi:hypothetical protein